MRFVKKDPRQGDTREVQKFLWFPKLTYSYLDKTTEFRWLERARWLETADYGSWRFLRWLDIDVPLPVGSNPPPPGPK